MLSPPRPIAALATALAIGAPAAAASAADAPNANLRLPPRTVGAGPVNATFAAGLSGWDWLGRAAPAIAGEPRRHARLIQNTTLISPPFAVPARAQAIALDVRSPDGGGLVVVRAQPVAGGPAIPLGTIAPGRTLAARLVGLGPARGRAVRLVLDPITALGRRIDVAGIGAPREQVRGWSIPAGAVAIPARSGGRVAVAAGDARLVSPAFRPGRRAAFATVLVRGSGRLTLRAAGRAASVTAAARWRRARVAIAGGHGLRLRLLIVPGAEPIELRGLGLVVRRVSIVSVRWVGPDRRTVVAHLLPRAAGIRVTARGADGRVLARGETDRRGRVRLRVPAGARELVSLADARHLPAARDLPA